ncbi:amidohydrolase family protein [Flagellimonas sp. 389]|uniref:amidohydrolase family protein n=1 Tax=Flagellimonas sp. 389 TaxID=2835862 RepID=UPI001BD5E5D6|nr:amidohydrolase family protein [Flagellimonas sp. 389]MBS9462869.1 amidohydrolase family protein [Flagellimonas sp. 389]
MKKPTRGIRNLPQVFHISMLLLVLIFLLGSCKNEKEGKPKYDLVISNVNLIDGTGKDMQRNVNVYVKESKISKIDTVTIESNEQKNVINGEGKYLIPGLFDCHAHTGDYKGDFPRFMHYGVTSVFITGGGTCTNEYFRQMRGMGTQDSIPAPRVFHTSQHLIVEGSHPVKTYNSSEWIEGESFFIMKDTAQISELVKRVSEYPISGIKLTIEDGPYPPYVERMPQEFVNHVNKEAIKNGTRVFAHVSDNLELQMAIDAGIKNLLHYTGVDLDFEKDKELIQRIYRDSISWVTTLMLDKSMMYPKNPEWFEVEGLKEIYPAEEFEKMNDTDYIFRAEEFMKYFQEYYDFDNPSLKQVVQFQVEDFIELTNNGVNMVLGTDTGNDFILPGYSLHEEMQLLELGGMPTMDIIKMGTLNAAKMLEVEGKLGSIEVGKIADMVLLDKNPLEEIKNTLSIYSVIKNGAVQQRIPTKKITR